ncbi:MFS transporter [Amycolatopsis sp. lyj-112]|uniref:MFS transporter n=1 Tax=Amycolatopsis sp. lyj-112 TaxID=2789288 RepID=UPI00397CA68E
MQRQLRLFLTATLIDALGSGIWIPFGLLFLVHGQGFGLVEAGAALSTGGLLALTTGPLAGAAMDRFGPRTLLIAGNLLRLAAFGCYPLLTSAWQVVAVTLVAGVGDRLFWTCNAPMVAALTTGRDAERVLGTQTVGRFAGAGAGAAASAVLPEITSPAAFHLIAYANAATFAVAAALIWFLPAPARMSEPVSEKDGKRGWKDVLSDRPYVRFCVTHMAFTLASASKFAILPILVRDFLHGPQWIAGTAITIGTVVVVSCQNLILRVLASHSRATGLIAAAVLFSASFALLIPVTSVPLRVATGLILVTSLTFSVAEAMFAPLSTAAAAEAAPRGAEGRASALFQLSWGLPVALAPAVLSFLLSVSGPLLWSCLAGTSLLAVPAVLGLRKTMPIGSSPRVSA